MPARLATLAVVVIAALAIGAPDSFAGCIETTLQEEPQWIDFADQTVSFRERLFGQPGVTVAIANGAAAKTLRRRGASTIFWEMKLERIVGVPAHPYLKKRVRERGDDLLRRARRSTGSWTPRIALNELRNPRAPLPWSKKETRYRENVLYLLNRLCSQGAEPWLLVPSDPHVRGRHGRWWRNVGMVAGVVREVYFPARSVMHKGADHGSYLMRLKMGRAVKILDQLAIPPRRQGIMLGYQSGGMYGRARAPRSVWLDYVALSTRIGHEVATSHEVATIWSWGWGTFSARGADRDKPLAACVYLYTRNPRLCDSPARS